MKSIIRNILAQILRFEAKLVLARFKPKIILVGGNVGKTSTKDTVFDALKGAGYSARKSAKSMNSEIGLPLSILALPNAWNNPFLWLFNLLLGFLRVFERKYPEYLVLELGADKKGDIKAASKWLKADILILTAIPDLPVHVENFKNKKELFEEKRWLIKTLKPGGILIYDYDFEKNRDFAKEFDGQKFTYSSKSAKADFTVKDTEFTCSPLKMRATLCHKKQCEDLEFVYNIGAQQIKPALAAWASLLALDSKFSLSEALKGKKRIKGRMSVLLGQNGSVIIDDTYNSSPEAVKAALDTLRKINCKNTRKITVLGDMLELGKFASEAHREVLSLAKESADKVYVCGAYMHEAAQHIGGVQAFKKQDFDKLKQALKQEVKQGDIVLIKASQGMRFEKLSKALLKDKKDVKHLPRQEKEWLKR